MPKALKIILFIAAAAALLAGGGFLLLRSQGHNAVYYMTHEETWETVSGNGYTMMMPSHMKKGQLLQTGDFQAVDCFVSDELVIGIARKQMTSEEQSVIRQTSDLTKLYRTSTHKITIDGKTLIPSVSGNMVYVEYPKNSLVIGDDVDEAWAVDACYLSGSTIYQVELTCRKEMYYAYKSYIFRWLESFTPS